MNFKLIFDISVMSNLSYISDINLSDTNLSIVSKSEFIRKNWEGEDRWRRIELNEFTYKLRLDLYDTDSNKDIFERILFEYIRQEKEENIRKEMLNDQRIFQLYNNFINQLPNEEYFTKNYEDIDYNFFVNHNKSNFFIQTKEGFDFLEYFLKTQIYHVNETNWFTIDAKYIYFHPDGKYIIM